MPSETCSLSKVGHAVSKTPILNTPQDYEGDPPPVLSNGASAGDMDVLSDVDQRNKENLFHHQDLCDHSDTIDMLDSEAKDGKPQHH